MFLLYTAVVLNALPTLRITSSFPIVVTIFVLAAESVYVTERC
jgi:hypothetical protein